MNTIFVGVAKVLWGFNVKGVQGDEVDTMDYRGGSLVRPPRFGVRFEVRSEAHKVIIEREAEAARVFMENFEKID
jgi:hypothetical protein